MELVFEAIARSYPIVRWHSPEFCFKKILLSCKMRNHDQSPISKFRMVSKTMMHPFILSLYSANCMRCFILLASAIYLFKHGLTGSPIPSGNDTGNTSVAKYSVVYSLRGSLSIERHSIGLWFNSALIASCSSC